MLFCFKQKVSNIKICTSLSYIKLWMREKQQLVREGSVLILTFTFVLKPHYLLFFPRRLSEHTISLKLLRSSHYLICTGKIKHEDCFKKKRFLEWKGRFASPNAGPCLQGFDSSTEKWTLWKVFSKERRKNKQKSFHSCCEVILSSFVHLGQTEVFF